LHASSIIKFKILHVKFESILTFVTAQRRR
jgi:hypothetical protein